MVSVHQVGAFAYWQQSHVFPYGSVVPCQWHPSTAVPAATSATAAPSSSTAACTTSSFASLLDSPLNSTFAESSFLSPLPLQRPVTHQYNPSSPLSSRAATVDPEQPIGYGSFGVVWSVLNPRDKKRAALKKIPSVFQSLLSCIRTFREVKILCEMHHENLLAATDIIHPPPLDQFVDVLVLSDLMESDLHQIIVSPQQLTEDHVKVFIYQVLRGLKYLHSAKIIHRDLKPGNLLVNSNCLLKICDFGFARAVEPDRNTAMTLEVVTQYYRAPELLAGCKHYDTAIDMWSVGCIFAELLGRRILFEASTPDAQLEMITDLLGTPSVEDVCHITSPSAVKKFLLTCKPAALSKLYQLAPSTSHGAVHLLSQMLIFNPEKRISCVDALFHPFLEDGKMRYHTYLCSCCHTSSNGGRVFARELEPSASFTFDFSYEKELTSIAKARAQLHHYICNIHPHLPPLFINIYAKHFKKFQNCSPGVPQTTTA